MFCVSSKELIKIPNNKLDRFQHIHQDFHNNVLQAQPVQRVQQTQLPSLTQLFYLREVFVLGPEQQLDSVPVEIWSDLNEAGTSKQPPLLPPPSRWSNASHLPFQGPMLYKFLHPQFMNVCNKLEFLLLAHLSSQVQYWRVKPGAYPRKKI